MKAFLRHTILGGSFLVLPVTVLVIVLARACLGSGGLAAVRGGIALRALVSRAVGSVGAGSVVVRRRSHSANRTCVQCRVRCQASPN